MSEHIQILVGDPVFQFTSKQDWIDKGPDVWRRHNVNDGRGLAVDLRGRIVQLGVHFERAEREATYPITVYRIQPDEDVVAMDGAPAA